MSISGSDFIDHLGNTRVVLDDQGSVKQYFDYYPFGMTQREQVSGCEKARYRYTGKELDEESDLDWYYFGARYYDPDIGRWLSVDPKAQDYLQWSPYVYSLDNPLRFIDPDGEDPFDIYGKLAQKSYEKLWNYCQDLSKKYTPKVYDYASSITNLYSYVDKRALPFSILFKVAAIMAKTDNPYYSDYDIAGDLANIIISIYDPATGEITDITVDNIGDLINIFKENEVVNIRSTDDNTEKDNKKKEEKEKNKEDEKDEENHSES